MQEGGGCSIKGQYKRFFGDGIIQCFDCDDGYTHMIKLYTVKLNVQTPR